MAVFAGSLAVKEGREEGGRGGGNQPTSSLESAGDLRAQTSSHLFPSPSLYESKHLLEVGIWF